MGRGGKSKGSKSKHGKGGKGGNSGGDQKRQKTDQLPYEDGECGFLVASASCQNALRGSKDLRLWLEVETEGVPDCDGVTEGGSTNVAPPPGSAAEQLDAELAALRNAGSKEALASRRFLPIGTVCRQVAFLRTQENKDVPSQLATLLLKPGDRKATEPSRFVSRFADQVFPVDVTSRPRIDEFEAMAVRFLSTHGGRTWRLVYEAFRGGWNTISKDDAMRVCKDTLTPEKLSVSDPEVTILCTVIPRFVGLAAMELDAEDLRVEYGEEDSTEDELERMKRRQCRYGISCTRRDCVFRHPEGRILPPLATAEAGTEAVHNVNSSMRSSLSDGSRASGNSGSRSPITPIAIDNNFPDIAKPVGCPTQPTDDSAVDGSVQTESTTHALASHNGSAERSG